MDNNKFKGRFKRKLFISASIGLLLACICVALISVLPLYNQLKAQRANHLIFSVKTKSMLVEEFLEKAKETAKQITSRSKAREALENYNSNKMDLTTLSSFSTAVLQDAIDLSQFAVGISRFDKYGKLVIQVGQSVPNKFLHPPIFTDNRPIPSGPITINNNSYIMVSAPIINRQRNQVGTDMVIFNITELKNIINDYTGMGQTGEAILVNMAANSQHAILFPTRSELDTDLKAHTTRRSTTVQQALTMISDHTKDICLHKTPHSLVAYGRIKGINWGMIVQMDRDELFGSITKQVWIISLIITFFVIPLGLLELILLLRPLSNRMIIHVDTLQHEIKAKENAIFERTRAEKKLLNEKERLNVTLRSIGDGVITTDLDEKVVLINKITEKLTGWSLQEAIGQPVSDVFNIINEQTGKRCENPITNVLTSQKIIGLANHTALISRDGCRYSIEDSAAPIFDKDSQIIGTVLVFRDVTATKRTTAELLKIKKLESVGVLAGGIAHDFNNILTAILGNIEMAVIHIGSTSDAYSLLQNAKKASLRAKDLTQQLLTFSKGGDPVKRTASIAKTITESANFVLHGSSISYKINIPSDLWLVDLDAGQISQVIQNLVINAKHAMPDGGEIQITCTNIVDIKRERPCGLEDRSYVKITLQDNGCGITEKHLEKIFDPYFTTKQEGSGLGLAISHSIINKHNGHIAVESQMGVGTTFTIYMPAAAKQTPHDSIQEASKQAGIKSKILVMDDEEFVQDIARHMLNRLGHEVLLAGDGQEAIRIFNEHLNDDKPIDIIIMDLTIPGGMGGQEAIKQILKIDPTAKIIVSSGYSNDPVMTNYQEYGFKAALAKPFLLEELNKTLKDIS